MVAGRHAAGGGADGRSARGGLSLCLRLDVGDTEAAPGDYYLFAFLDVQDDDGLFNAGLDPAHRAVRTTAVLAGQTTTAISPWSRPANKQAAVSSLPVVSEPDFGIVSRFLMVGNPLGKDLESAVLQSMYGPSASYPPPRPRAGRPPEAKAFGAGLPAAAEKLVGNLFPPPPTPSRNRPS
jgi:hypothetical protein